MFYPLKPSRAAELGRKGGIGNRHVYQNDAEEVASPQSISDVKQMLAEAMAAMRSGKLTPRLPGLLTVRFTWDARHVR